MIYGKKEELMNSLKIKIGFFMFNNRIVNRNFITFIVFIIPSNLLML